jgi:hypothetical protein
VEKFHFYALLQNGRNEAQQQQKENRKNFKRTCEMAYDAAFRLPLSLTLLKRFPLRHRFAIKCTLCAINCSIFDMDENFAAV